MNEELKKLEELLANDRKIIEDNYKEIERLLKDNKLLQDMDKILRNENTNLKLEIERLNNAIDRAIAFIEQNLLPSHNIKNTDWEFEEVIYSDLPVGVIKPLIDILKEVNK